MRNTKKMYTHNSEPSTEFVFFRGKEEIIVLMLLCLWNRYHIATGISYVVNIHWIFVIENFLDFHAESFAQCGTVKDYFNSFLYLSLNIWQKWLHSRSWNENVFLTLREHVKKRKSLTNNNRHSFWLKLL